MKINILRNKNKKGQIFTILAIVLIALMFVSFELLSIYQDRQTVKIRVTTMQSFMNSMEENLERQLFISGFRILFLAGEEITKGNYIVVDDFFNETFFNGTINGVTNSTILEGATYNDIINSINNKSKKINVEVIIDNSTLDIRQIDPWNVQLTLSSDFVLQDKSGLAKWQKKQNITSSISVEHFEDPLYLINSNSQITRKINRTIYEGNYADGGDISNFSKHVSQGYYASNSDAPSFLNRLEGNLSADPNGIESFVDRAAFLAISLDPGAKSCVDHIYFSADDPSNSAVVGMPGIFRIDANHSTFYGLP